MKKYFIAAMVAMVAFAMAAFAASLTVNAGPLQAGSATDLKCTDSVDVDFTGFEGDLYDAAGDKTIGGGFVRAQLSGLGTTACDGAIVYLRIFDNDDVEIWRSDPIPTASGNTLVYSFASGKTRGGYSLYRSSLNQGSGSVIRSADIARADVQIDG